MHEQENNRQVGQTIATCNLCGHIVAPDMEIRYRDEYGETWARFCPHLILRLSDSNIGGFFRGKGLIAVPSKTE